MIIIFYLKDVEGKSFRLSAICPPATTAVGAVTLLRHRMSIPSSVSVEVFLQNDLPIRHVTVPLASLRKQREGSAQVLQIRLWVVFDGDVEVISLIDFSHAEAEVTEEDGVANGEDGTVAHEAWRADPEVDDLDMPLTTPRIVKTKQLSVKAPVKISKPLVDRDMVDAEKKRMMMMKKNSEAEETGDVVKAKKERKPVELHKAPVLETPRQTQQKQRQQQQQQATQKEMVNAKPQAEVKTNPAKKAVDAGEEDEMEVSHVSLLTVKSRTGCVYRVGRARRDANFTSVLLREYPKLIDMSLPEMIATLKDDDRFLNRAYNTEYLESSPVDGVDDATFSRCVSLLHIYAVEPRIGAAALPTSSTGLPLATPRGPPLGVHTSSSCSNSVNQQVALYGELASLRHSCRPNTAVHYDRYKEPYPGACRCAVLEGIKANEELTYLYRHVDSQAFMLLSRDRRRHILKHKYFFDCECVRCQQTTNRVDDAEASLTGAFFTDSSVDKDEAQQADLSHQMHKDFDELQLMDDTGIDITLSLSGNVPPNQRVKQCNRILAFIRKYTGADAQLRLNDHHWRVNLARLAYIQETVRLCAVKGSTPEARRKDPDSRTLFTPMKTVYDVCIKQLEVEALFIPAGHPHRITTFDCFQFVIAVLPPSMQQSVVRNALLRTSVDMKELEETKNQWEVFKRTLLPLQLRNRIVASTSGK